MNCIRPGGNWSSYPPRKHDTHKTDDKGKVLEAQLDRFSFFKFDRPTGYAYQRVYSEDGRANVIVQARQHDVVTMPSGFYTLVSAPGTTDLHFELPWQGPAEPTPRRPIATTPGVADTLTAIDPPPARGRPGHGKSGAKTQFHLLRFSY